MTIGTRLFTWLNGAFVGADEDGNRYFKERRTPSGRREKRWVLYNGEAEASRVPPEWHAWLHHTIEAAPVARRPRKAWQKPHQPNLTGTAEAYRPPGHDFAGGVRARATGDYEPWRPD